MHRILQMISHRLDYAWYMTDAYLAEWRGDKFAMSNYELMADRSLKAYQWWRIQP